MTIRAFLLAVAIPVLAVLALQHHPAAMQKAQTEVHNVTHR